MLSLVTKTRDCFIDLDTGESGGEVELKKEREAMCGE